MSQETRPAPSSGSTAPEQAGGQAGEQASTPVSRVDEILRVLDQVRPYLNQDGGDVEFISFEDGIVNVKLHGACGTCPSSLMTLRMGIENALREVVPEVQEVRNVAPATPPGGGGHVQLGGLG